MIYAILLAVCFWYGDPWDHPNTEVQRAAQQARP
jgi:hypothetical protein